MFSKNQGHPKIKSVLIYLHLRKNEQKGPSGIKPGDMYSIRKTLSNLIAPVVFCLVSHSPGYFSFLRTAFVMDECEQ